MSFDCIGFRYKEGFFMSVVIYEEFVVVDFFGGELCSGMVFDVYVISYRLEVLIFLG